MATKLKPQTELEAVALMRGYRKTPWAPFNYDRVNWGKGEQNEKLTYEQKGNKLIIRAKS